MSKVGVLMTNKWLPRKPGQKEAEVQVMHARFTLRCDFCVARNRFGVDPAVEWNPMEPATLSSFEFREPITAETELDGWNYIPASDFPVPHRASNDRNWTPPAVKQVCSLCMAQHFPEDDR